jgi:Flp pilus assembly protein TadG
MRRPPATRRSQRGQSLVELTLALPVIVLLAVGLFDAGRAVIDYTTLTNAARAGARVAIVNQSNDASCATVRTFKCVAADQAVAMGISAASIPDLSLTGSHCDVSGTCAVTVTVSHPIRMVTPLVGELVGPLTLSASATMPLERAHVEP